MPKAIGRFSQHTTTCSDWKWLELGLDETLFCPFFTPIWARVGEEKL